MAPQRFEIGQPITPIDNKPFIEVYSGNPSSITFGKIYHVAEYGRWDNMYKCWCIKLEEMPHERNFDEDCFAPVISDKALTELLEESLQPQTI